jgi:hypothetical protein
LLSGPPANTTASGPVWSHQFAFRMPGFPEAVTFPVGTSPSGTVSFGIRRGCNQLMSAAVGVGHGVAVEGADQAEGLPLVLGGVGAGAARNPGEVIPAANTGATVALAGAVGEQVPGDPVPHLVSDVHGQRFGGVVLEVPRVLQVLVGAAFQSLTRQAKALAYGLRAVTVALMLSGPVGIDLGARHRAGRPA